MELKIVWLDVTETPEATTNITAQMDEKWGGVVQMRKGMSVGRMMHLRCFVAITNSMRMNLNILVASEIQ